jgi:hypothetical protein
MKTLIFLCIVIFLCAPAGALRCSNVKIQASGASLNDKISCDTITGFEVSPELSFLNVRQDGNDILLSGNIQGIDKTGFIRIYGKDESSGSQINIKTAMRVPVVINQGSTPTPTATPTPAAADLLPVAVTTNTVVVPRATLSPAQNTLNSCISSTTTPHAGIMEVLTVPTPTHAAIPAIPTGPFYLAIVGLFVVSVFIGIYAWRKW